MFKIQKQKSAQYTKLKLLNTETKECANLIPEFGANLNELILAKNKKSHSIIDGDKTYNTQAKNKWFKSRKLFPYPNRINNATYTFQKKTYSLPVNFPAQNHAIHGLVYNKNFKIKKTKTQAQSAKAELQYNYKKEIPAYPFTFQLKIKYTLTKEGINCTTTVKNTGKENMPMGDGWHPYFKTEGKIDNITLKLPAKTKINVNKKMIPTGKTTQFTKFSEPAQIKKQELDTGFILSKKEGIKKTELHDKKQDIKIIIWQETGIRKYNYLQVFIPPKRTSIAIEPMTCSTDAFNNKEGLIILNPNDTFSASFGIYLK